MNELRWILLVAGTLLVIGIYLWGRRTRPSVSDQPPASLGVRAERSVPQLDDAVVVRSRVPDVAPIIRTESSFDADQMPSIRATDFGRETGAEAILGSDGESRVATGDPPRNNSIRQDSTTDGQQENRPNANAESIQKSPARRKIVALRLTAGENRVDGAKLKSWFEEAGLRHGKFDIFHRVHDDSGQLFSVASMVEPGTFDPHAMAGVQFPGVTLFLQLPGPIDGMEMVSQMLACARDLERKMGGILQDERGLPLTDVRAQRLRDEAADFLHLLGRG